MDSVIQFNLCQIVALKHEKNCLYSEVIQVIPARQLCWVRPLILVTQVDDAGGLALEDLIDLRNTVDLLWPSSLFRLALDTEVIPLLVQLDNPDNLSENNQQSRQQLRGFLEQVWQAYQGKGKSCDRDRCVGCVENASYKV